MRWIVVVLLLLPSWVGDWTDRHVKPEYAARFSNARGELIDCKRLCELVHNAQLTRGRRCRGSKLDALERIFEVEIASCLASAAIDGQRHAGDRLDQETVYNGTKYIIVMEVRQQSLVEAGLHRCQTVDRALHEVSDPHAVEPHVEPQEVGVSSTLVV